MKKVLLSIGLALSIFASATAQEEQLSLSVFEGAAVKEKIKIAKDFSHEAGDMSLSVGANPFAAFAGNLFNGTMDNSAPSFDALATTNAFAPVIMSKFFVSDRAAIRVSLGFDFNKEIVKTMAYNAEEVYNNAQKPVADQKPLHDLAQVTNVETISQNDIELGVGYEWRRGEKRLQAFYGGGIILSATGGSTKNKWGNPIAAIYNEEVTPRNLVNKYGTSFGLGLNGFIGVEYFITPGISLGGEFGVRLLLKSAAKGKVTKEYWDTNTKTVEDVTMTDYTSAGEFDFGTKATGNIFLSFYF